MRADDSSGIIGDACRRLLRLHARLAGPAHVPPSRLVEWMVTFQFDNECDFFTIDPVHYAPALGKKGMAAYRARLDALEAGLGPRPSEEQRWSSAHSHEWFTLDWNARRLAVLDRDVEAVIRTHATSPRDAVGFALLSLQGVRLAWSLAHSLRLEDDRVWSDLAKAYEKADRLAVLPVLSRLVEHELSEAAAQHYRIAARRLAKMRKLAVGSEKAAEVEEFIAALRETHRRRPRLQQEFDRAGLP
ncbi:hypothetical protein [Georgenia sp. AZ-5]|uniref:hypothetical protein n=1 Tax=Georgenia sp. AZ-5 TaxID=3367526 RepID=UPI003754B196